MSDIAILETIYTCLIIVSVSVALPLCIYCLIKFCIDKFEKYYDKAKYEARIKSHYYNKTNNNKTNNNNVKKQHYNKAKHEGHVKSHLKYIWFELYNEYGQDVGLARCFDNFCRTHSLHCFYKHGILFWQYVNGTHLSSPVESREIARDILRKLMSMSLYDRLEIGIPKDYQLSEKIIDDIDYI